MAQPTAKIEATAATIETPTIKLSKEAPWYLGGMASIGSVSFTHPLDTIKVQLQTQQKAKFGVVGMASNMVKTTGFLSLYNGLSAAMLRQATYSTVRFGVYDIGKKAMAKPGKESPFYEKILIAGLAGGAGGIVGKLSTTIVDLFHFHLTRYYSV